MVLTFPLHWADMDALGHANNARYFTWFESARIAYFLRIGLLADRPREVGPILATTTCDFLRPLVYPADITVGARVTKVGTTSLHMAYALARADVPTEPVARGTGVVVLVNYTTGQRVEVPPALRAAMDSLEATRPPPVE